jgi:hypothetical protein
MVRRIENRRIQDGLCNAIGDLAGRWHNVDYASATPAQAPRVPLMMSGWAGVGSEATRVAPAQVCIRFSDDD